MRHDLRGKVFSISMNMQRKEEQVQRCRKCVIDFWQVLRVLYIDKKVAEAQSFVFSS
jgi:hypothetical protein